LDSRADDSNGVINLWFRFAGSPSSGNEAPAKEQLAPQGRHRDGHGEISRTHGKLGGRPLRRRYGLDFARGFSNDEKLEDVLGTPRLNVP
jgi:hypothetical protein